MDIASYLSQPAPLRTSSRVCFETEWLDMGRLVIASGKLGIADPNLFPSDYVSVELRNGNYGVAVKLMEYGSNRRVSRLQVLEGNDGSRGSQIGSVIVDFAQLGVCDLEATLLACHLLDEEAQSAITKVLDSGQLYGLLQWDLDSSAPMPFVRPGFGDDEYPIYELRNHSLRVGIEIVFIENLSMSSGANDVIDS
jgi:hypothetical protein